MISINATPTKLPLSLGGNVPPYSLMTDSNVVGVEEWGLDNTKVSDGLVYPVDYDTTTQAVVDTMLARLAVSGKSSNVYTTTQKRRKVLGRFNNGYKGLSSLMLHTPSLGATAPTVASFSTHEKNMVDIGNNTIIEVGRLDIGAGAQLVARAITCSGESTLTHGTATAVSADNPAIADIIVFKLSAGKAVVVWRLVSDLKACVLTVVGQTITVNAVSTVKTDYQNANNGLIGARTISADKIAIAYKGTTNVGCFSATIVADEIGVVGATVAVSTSPTVYYAVAQLTGNGANQMNVFKDDHFVFTYIASLSSPNVTIRSYHFSVSGTVVSEETYYTKTVSSPSASNWQMPRNDDNNIVFFTLPASTTISNHFYLYLGTDNKMYAIEELLVLIKAHLTTAYLEKVSATQYNWLGGTTGELTIINIIDGVLTTSRLFVTGKITTEFGRHIRTGDYYFFLDNETASSANHGCFKLGNIVTVDLNGVEVISEALDNKLVAFNLYKVMGGDKAYIEITNDDLETKNIELKAVIAGIA